MFEIPIRVPLKTEDAHGSLILAQWIGEVTWRWERLKGGMEGGLIGGWRRVSCWGEGRLGGSD